MAPKWQVLLVLKWTEPFLWYFAIFVCSLSIPQLYGISHIIQSFPLIPTFNHIMRRSHCHILHVFCPCYDHCPKIASIPCTKMDGGRKRHFREILSILYVASVFRNFLAVLTLSSWVFLWSLHLTTLCGGHIVIFCMWETVTEAGQGDPSFMNYASQRNVCHNCFNGKAIAIFPQGRKHIAQQHNTNVSQVANFEWHT